MVVEQMSPFLETDVQDEGYSEDPLGREIRLSRASRPHAAPRLSPHAVAEAATTFDQDDRISVALHIMRTLPPAKVQDIVNAMYPILHISFLDRLPPEICLKILGMLDSESLIRVACASKLAFSLAFDWTVWQNVYYREGFLINDLELGRFEQQLAESNEKMRQHVRSRPSASSEAPPRKRSRPSPDESQSNFEIDDSEMIDVDPAYAFPKASIFGGPSIFSGNVRSPRHDASIDGDKPVFSPPYSPPTFDHNHSTSSSHGLTSDLDAMSSLTVFDRKTNSRRLNWQFLYTQRRKLEANWHAERYVNYQLPHPDHPEEAHTECIYTLQHDGRQLVTGSRDHTVRVWSLDTQRLVHILKGHTKSVLCIQFDAKEDIVISGSGDQTVRIWRLSTGEPLKVLKKAHADSILNLKFNKDILVTCSKDKTIKIFNRHKVKPGDDLYPVPKGFVKQEVPTNVVNFPGVIPSPWGDLPDKEAFSLLKTLEGHGAAVNAVQIFNNEIVSASGDRLAKVWDWKAGSCIRSFVGHSKGVACVEYDGRRVVTGSSDCEIKVFDRNTAVEVASLKGHTNLVRTIQSGFGDVEGSAEEDYCRARSVDNSYHRAMEQRQEMWGRGVETRWSTDGRRFARNAGSDRPEDIISYGATLPPGGGGGPYGRIVSGSYDETVVIWRRDRSGVWKAKTVFRQAEGARKALLNNEIEREPPANTDILDSILPTLVNAENTPNWYRELAGEVVQRGVEALRQAVFAYPQIIQYTRLLQTINTVAGTALDPATGQQIVYPHALHTRAQMRAVVEAGMWHEMGRCKRHISYLQQDMYKTKSQIKASERRSAECEAWQGQRDAIWRRTLIQHESRQPQMMGKSQFADLDDTQSLTAHPRVWQQSEDLQAGSSHSGSGSNTPRSSIPRRGTEKERYFALEERIRAELRSRLAETSRQKEAYDSQHQHLAGALASFSSPAAAQQAAAQAQAALQAQTVAQGGVPIAPGAQAQAVPAPAPDADQSRVFKLQFDARRIICCSSKPVIVIWDFANRDRDIEEASRLFKGVQ